MKKHLCHKTCTQKNTCTGNCLYVLKNAQVHEEIYTCVCSMCQFMTYQNVSRCSGSHSLVTLTPSSGPFLIDEANKQTHTHTLTLSFSKSNKQLLLHVRWKETGYWQGMWSNRSCCMSKQLTTNRTENVHSSMTYVRTPHN